MLFLASRKPSSAAYPRLGAVAHMSTYLDHPHSNLTEVVARILGWISGQVRHGGGQASGLAVQDLPVGVVSTGRGVFMGARARVVGRMMLVPPATTSCAQAAFRERLRDVRAIPRIMALVKANPDVVFYSWVGAGVWLMPQLDGCATCSCRVLCLSSCLLPWPWPHVPSNTPSPPLGWTLPRALLQPSCSTTWPARRPCTWRCARQTPSGCSNPCLHAPLWTLCAPRRSSPSRTCTVELATSGTLTTCSPPMTSPSTSCWWVGSSPGMGATLPKTLTRGHGTAQDAAANIA